MMRIKDGTSSKSHNLIDPSGELGYSRVDAGLVGKRTADAPRDDTDQLPLVFLFDDQRSSRVSLIQQTNRLYPLRVSAHRRYVTYFTRVFASFGHAGADKYIRNIFDVAGSPVHRFAIAVCDHRNLDVLQDVWEWSICVSERAKS